MRAAFLIAKWAAYGTETEVDKISAGEFGHTSGASAVRRTERRRRKSYPARITVIFFHPFGYLDMVWHFQTAIRPGANSMKSAFRIVKFGVAVWFVPFAIGMVIFPVVPPETALFETIMAVSMAASATAFSIMYFRKADGIRMVSGLIIGTIWWALAVALDTPWFLMMDQMKMPFAVYAADIGLTYAMIPIIAGGICSAFGRE